jgi:hypothetical protein
MFDAFTCRRRKCPQDQSLTGSVELSNVTDWTQPICSNVAKWLAQSRTPS